MFETVGLLAYENDHQRSSGSGLKRGFEAAGWNFPKPMEMERRPQVHHVLFPSGITVPPGPAIAMMRVDVDFHAIESSAAERFLVPRPHAYGTRSDRGGGRFRQISTSCR
ncbi:hypothetical protein LZ554_006552 [Drepanopeziza brunnea f. sp. 'monogermtubi']|nr:hypothetical protein LZ554_006552 [Drepanopeziza brunnea f. sp. 'monogermtubi']